MNKIKITAASFLLLFLMLSPLARGSALALEDKILGVHLLSTRDLDHAKSLLAADKGEKFATIPLTFQDLNHQEEWQRFFNDAKANNFIPIVRLATESRDGIWSKPNRRQIVHMFEFLNQLDWPDDELHIIVFNEVNHAKEWGGDISPQEYAQVLDFTCKWAHTEAKDYIVLPAAMDLAAPNGSETMEAFTYLEAMYRYNPKIFNQIDIWNSHSYPNPAFSSSPTRSAKNSMRGFIHELNYLKRKTGRDFEVIITETGWKANRQTAPWLNNYYLYAFQHIWSHPQVIGVTPFVVQGSPGPFESFSFYDAENNPTIHFDAFQNALIKTEQKIK